MAITIKLDNNNSVDSMVVNGSWSPKDICGDCFRRRMASDKQITCLKDLTTGLFDQAHYTISSCELVGKQLVIKYQDRSPSAFVFTCTSDQSNQFEDPHMPLSMDKLHSEFNRVESSFVRSMKEIDSATQDAANIQVLWLRGHANSTHMRFGKDGIEDCVLTLDNIEKYSKIFKRVNLKTGVIFLDGCCEEKENLLAEKIHRLTGRKVCANENNLISKGRVYVIQDENGQFIMQTNGNLGFGATIFFQNQRLKCDEQQLRKSIKDQGYAISDQKGIKNREYLEHAFEEVPFDQLQKWYIEGPNNSELSYLLGCAYSRKGNEKRAQELFNEACLLGNRSAKKKLKSPL